jgi:hypothetical protein
MKRLLLVSAISLFSVTMHAMNTQNQSTPPKKISAFAKVKPQPPQQRSAFIKVNPQHPMLVTLNNSKQIAKRSNGKIIVRNAAERHQHEAARRQNLRRNEDARYEDDAVLALNELLKQARAQAFTVIPANTKRPIPAIKVTPNNRPSKSKPSRKRK